MDEDAAVAVVVGDELLQGHTLDTNSHLLAQRLGARGIPLRRKEIVGDEPAQIERALRRAIEEDRVRFVFVIGGIGPTPDDRTYQGVSLGLGVPLEIPPEGREWMERTVRERSYAADLWASPERAEPLLRMVRLPQGARILRNPVGLALGCAAQKGPSTVFVLPGVPREFEAMLSELEHSFLSGFHAEAVVRELECFGEEAHLFEIMRTLETEIPTVRIGSYPQPGGRIVLRLQGPLGDVDHAQRPLAEAARRMPKA